MNRIKIASTLLFSSIASLSFAKNFHIGLGVGHDFQQQPGFPWTIQHQPGYTNTFNKKEDNFSVQASMGYDIGKFKKVTIRPSLIYQYMDPIHWTYGLFNTGVNVMTGDIKQRTYTISLMMKAIMPYGALTLALGAGASYVNTNINSLTTFNGIFWSSSAIKVNRIKPAFSLALGYPINTKFKFWLTDLYTLGHKPRVIQGVLPIPNAYPTIIMNGTPANNTIMLGVTYTP